MPELNEILQPGSHWGFLGGAFDPPHLGHLALARTLCDCAELDGVLFCPTFAPPHKRAPQATFEQRVEMTRLSVGTDRNFVVTDIERGLPTPSYTVQTIRELLRRYPAVRFSILVGG
ncbi:MAG TPA: nicotinate-nicotinamide nucleotide adenylyltransferase, partial [candidate division Zixibacteria bacterium]|nr:nicotinate-nicotinamide nucleotide adenylyltransferase [candidate division Zixibacteria bacterium]